MYTLSHINKFSQERSFEDTRNIVSKMKEQEKRLLVFFIYFFRSEDYNNPSQEFIAEHLGISTKTVIRTLKILCSLGLMGKIRIIRRESHYFLDPHLLLTSNLKKLKPFIILQDYGLTPYLKKINSFILDDIYSYKYGRHSSSITYLTYLIKAGFKKTRKFFSIQKYWERKQLQERARQILFMRC